MAAAAYAYALSVSVEMHNLNLQQIKRHVLIASTLQSNQYLYLFISIYILKQKPINLEQPRAMRSIMILLL